MKIKLYFFTVLTLFFSIFAGCKKDVSEAPYLKLSTKSVSFNADGNTRKVIKVSSNTDWKPEIAPRDEWIKIEYDKEKIIVSTSKSLESREGVININSAIKKETIKVIQLGENPELKFINVKSPLVLSAQAKDFFRISYASNLEKFKVSIPEEVSEWIKIKEEPKFPSRSTVEGSFVISITENKTFSIRKGTITLECTEKPELSLNLEIIQNPASSNAESVTIPQNPKLRVTGGKDSEHQPGQGIEKSYDGVIEGGWAYHSIWNQKAQFPVKLEYYFDGNTLPCDYIVYHSRNGNGNFGKFDLYYKDESHREWTLLGHYDFKESGGKHRISFGRIVPLAFKFEVHNGYSGFVSCAEMEFFSMVENPENESLKRVFTDMSCSALKPGVSETDISSLSPFFKTLANQISQNMIPESEKRFRIQSYKAYSIPEDWANKLKINSYSHLNNPTGIIYDNPGKPIVVLADGIGSNTVKLSCYPGIGPGNASEAIITDGINKVSFTNKGNLFVIYETENPVSKSNIKVHIPSQIFVDSNNKEIEIAKVGYNVWDKNIDKTDEKFREYIQKCVKVTRNGSEECIFVLKGDKIVFTANSELLKYQDRQKGYGVKSGIERWDRLQEWEQELANISKYVKTGEFNNLMHVTTLTDGLYATSYYINMASGKDLTTRDGWGFKNNFDHRDMDKAQDNTWGPGHELGHMHQGAINWPSTTESSNNMFSNYVVYKIGKWGSRGSSLTTLAKYRYVQVVPWARFLHPLKENSKPGDPDEQRFNPFNMTDADKGKNGLYVGEDAEMHMRMNQQLWTYFVRCGKDPDVFNRIFDNGRTEFILPYWQPGKAQLIYAKNVAKACNMDMTEFFDTWCFFIPVKKFRFVGYGAVDYEVTQEMIDETKAYMKQFPKKCPPIQYIEDRKYDANARGNEKGRSVSGCDVGYFETYKNNVKITKQVKYSLSGRTYSITDGDQAVAFEIKRGDSVIYFSNRFQFTVPQGIDLQNAKLYAVQYDGRRIEITAN